MKRPSQKSLLFALGCFLALGFPGLVQSQDLDFAKRLSSSGKYREAETVLSRILLNSPSDIEAVLASAYNHSWMGKQVVAITEFEHVLKTNSDRTDARMGLGFAQAWAKQYTDARNTFLEILQDQPDNKEAKKGLAYVYLWSGDNKNALQLFRGLIRKAPREHEYYLAVGFAHLKMLNYREAKNAIKQALRLSPGSIEILNLLDQLNHSTKGVWLDVLGGYSWLEQNETEIGLRLLQISTQLGPKWQAFVKYDNSLSLDILDFTRRGEHAAVLSTGGVHKWNNKTMTEVEYGIRFLPILSDQHIVQAAQVFFFPNNLRLKLGAYASFSKELETAWKTYISINVKASPHIHVEPSYFYVQTDRISSPQHWAHLGFQYRSDTGYEFSVGGLFGTRGLQFETTGRKNTFGWDASGLIPITKIIWGQFFFQQEKGLFRDFSSLGMGVKVRLY